MEEKEYTLNYQPLLVEMLLTFLILSIHHYFMQHHFASYLRIVLVNFAYY